MARRQRLTYFLVCVGLPLLIYGGMVRFYFTDVDTFSLINDGRYHTWAEIWEILTSELMAGRMVNAIYFRPLTTFFLGTEYLFFGLDPVGYHIVDLLLFMGAAALVMAICEQGFGGPRGFKIGLWAGILFVCHPVALDNVPAIARVGDLLATVFVLGAILGILRFALSPAALPWPSYAVSVLCVFLGLCAKEPAVVGPAICAVILFLLSQERSLWKRFRHAFLFTSPHLLVTALFFLWRWRVVSGLGGYVLTSGKFESSFFSSYRTKSAILGHLGGFFVPTLSDDFDRYAEYFFERNFVIYPAFVLFLFCVCTWAYPFLKGEVLRPFQIQDQTDRDRRITTIFLSFLSIHFVLLTGTFFAIRYLYLPLTAWSIVLAFGLLRLWEGRRSWTVRRFVWATLAFVILIGAYGRTPLWDRQKLQRWGWGGEVSRAVTQDLGEIARQFPGEQVFLLNIPYAMNFGRITPIFWEIPFNQILLEHAIVDYMDLQSRKHGLIPPELIVLNYLYFQGHPRNCAMETRFVGANEIVSRVMAGGIPSAFPWSEIPGRQRYEELFETVGGKIPFEPEPPGGWPREMRISLQPQALAGKSPRFFAFNCQQLVEITR